MVETPTQQRAEVRPMTEAERAEVQRLQQQGLGVREIARRFGRAPSTISRILREAGARPRRAAPARAARAPARARAARGRVTGEVSRQEMRSLEQRIAKIENSLNRMAAIIRGAKPSGRKR